ncbi:MAG: phosphotransferase [Bacteroidetes bacterium]|nr:phosphotransferase [Bacteroidota bacterium]
MMETEDKPEFPIVPGRGLVTRSALELRLGYMQQQQLPHARLAATGLSPDEVKNNIESFVGGVELPLGLIGPLLFVQNGQREWVHGVAATLEGALIGSMNRGAKAISLCGGFTASVKWQRMNRVPMFLFDSEADAAVFLKFALRRTDELRRITSAYSNHARLQEISGIQTGMAVHLNFVYTTGDASGQNMTTTCTWHAMLHLAKVFQQATGIVPLDFVIEGNGSADKKISQYNIQHGRGVNVTATCTLSDAVLHQVLRTNSAALLRCLYPSQELAAKHGMVGYNINVANAVAAIFAATGQDLACIHESSIGFLQLEETADGMTATLNLPNLVIGTVGGGTQLSRQAEALEIMQCRGTGKVERLASLIAGFALGLELSTYSAIVSGEFAKAHEKLGRNKPVNWLLRSELTPEFLQRTLQQIPAEEIRSVRVLDHDLLDNGILTHIASRISKKLIGFVPLEITGMDGRQRKLLLKSKATDDEVIKGLHVMAASIDPELSDRIRAARASLEYTGSHWKEAHIYHILSRAGYENIPVLAGFMEQPEREIYLFVQEFLDMDAMHIARSENAPELWHETDIKNTICAITNFHRNPLQQELQEIPLFEPWNALPLYEKLMQILIGERAPENLKTQLQELQGALPGLKQEAQAIALERVVVHNDFNPRNIVIRSSKIPVIYDWELAVKDLPHRDIAEFLAFVLPDDFTQSQLMDYVKFHYSLYPDTSWKEWIKAMRYALKVCILTRFSFYEVAGILVRYDFSARILTNALQMLKYLEDEPAD